jgi:uncharacterized protein
LRKEWQLILNKFYSDLEWYELNITFLKNHRYFSPFGKNTLEAQQKINISKLRNLYHAQKSIKLSKIKHSLTA